MNMDEKKQLQRAMEEASLLPPHDPQRRSVESQIAQAEEWAHKEWADWLQLNEQLKLELLRVSAPPQWQEHLLKLPESSPIDHDLPDTHSHTHPSRSAWVWKWVAMAALFMLLTAGGLAGWYAKQQSFSSQIEHLAILALNDHMKRPRLEVTTSEWPRLVEQMKGTFPFSPIQPKFVSSLRLSGGRKCYLARRLVLLSRWHGSQGDYTLFQFRPQDFRLPSSLRKTHFPAQSLVLASKRTSAWLWSEQKAAFVLIHETY